MRYITGHRAKDHPLDLDWKSLASPDTTLVIYMGVANMAEIALRLLHDGLPPDLPVLAIANATTPRETRLLSQLDRISRDLDATPLPGPVLFIVGQVVTLYRDAPLALLAPGLDAAPEASAHA